jgi:2-polyprenyl-6-methoxyphenol hydroxylase-like FAD-dependent oxidoreductase
MEELSSEGRGVGCVERVLIVGGGIAGLTFASALHAHGIHAEVIEREREWHALGAGLSVQPNGLRVLANYGLDKPVVASGMPVERWVFADQFGSTLSEIDLAAVWGGVGPFIGTARTRLQDALVAGARDVPCRLGTSVSAIRQSSNRVQVDLTDGSSAEYDLVVGADGIRSQVRDMIFGKTQPIFAGQISWRSIAPIALPGRPSVQFWLGDRCFFGLCSIAEGWTYGFGYVSRARAHDPVEGRLDRLRRRFSNFGSIVQRYLEALEEDQQIHCSTIEWIEAETWHKGRVALIGDAAHASSPMMGQGGSLAMEDAHVLAELLRIETNLDDALAKYTARRRPRVQWVQGQSRRVADSFDLDPAIRNEVLRDRGEAMFKERYAPLTADP